MIQSRAHLAQASSVSPLILVRLGLVPVAAAIVLWVVPAIRGWDGLTSETGLRVVTLADIAWLCGYFIVVLALVRRTDLHALYVRAPAVASALLFALSLPLPAMADESMVVHGWMALYLSPSLLAMGQAAWLANPASLLAVASLAIGRRQAAIAFAVLASIFAIMALIPMEAWWDLFPMPGYWMWLVAMSMPLVVVASSRPER